MYTPSPFLETRVEALHGLIRDYPFATVVVSTHDGPSANHLPLEPVDGALQGHVARGNELARMDGARVLVIFHGPDGYISPTWYPTKRETGREVPTWNYAVVHVHGRLSVIEDAQWLRRQLQQLTDRHEAGQPEPWHLGDAPADHVSTLLRGIVGIAVAIDRIEGKFKLSQNHPDGNRAGVIAGLRERNVRADRDLSRWMLRQEAARP